MIIELDEAMLIDDEITQEDLDALEETVRQLTNNKFHHDYIKVNGFALAGNEVISDEEFTGFEAGGTIEVVGTKYNDGLYTVVDTSKHSLVVKGEFLVNEYSRDGLVVRVDYPPDIVSGVKSVIDYRKKTAGNEGVSSKSISRVSVSYESNTDTDLIHGVPKNRWSFLDRYKKIRW